MHDMELKLKGCVEIVISLLQTSPPPWLDVLQKIRWLDEG